ALLQRVFEGIPPQDVSLVVTALPAVYLRRLVRLIATVGEQSPHLEFILLWTQAVLQHFGETLQNKAEYEVELRALLKMLKRVQKELTRLADESRYTLEYLLEKPAARKAQPGVKSLPAIDLMNGYGESDEDMDDEEMQDLG